MSVEHDDEFSKERAVVRLEEMFLFARDDPHDPPGDDLSRRRYIDTVLAAGETYRPLCERPRSFARGRLAVIGMAAAGAAAAVALALALRGGERVPAIAMTQLLAARPDPSSFDLVAGSATAEVTEQGERLLIGAEGALLSLDGRIAVFVRSGSLLRMRPEAGRVDLDLESGALLANVDPAAHAPGLVVTTPEQRLEVTGTVLAVYAEPDRAAVEVLRGAVEVSGGGRNARLRTGESLEAAGAPRRIDDARASSLLSGAEEILLAVQGRSAAPAELAVIGESLERGAASGYRADGASMAAAAASGERTMPVAPTARQLLEEARDARKQHDWAGAAARYRDLLRRYPTAGESGVAHVDLGTVELTRLGHPEAALSSFDRYLAVNRGGPLEAEALWGKANALRALGRAAQERTALEALVVFHPEAFQAEEARRRLARSE
jgi:hypothetical protein